jgi:serine/threonine-protein kinase OSR1/STK39
MRLLSTSKQNNISREAQTMILVDHPNVLKSHCSFVSDHNLWVVMPFMAGGSCLHILKAAYPDGFEEVVIATILRDILKGLEYLHHHGHIHRDVKVSILFSFHPDYIMYLSFNNYLLLEIHLSSIT